MPVCPICRETRPVIAAALGACVQCLRRDGGAAAGRAEASHRKCRTAFHLPVKPPDAAGGLQCGVCAHGCRIGPGQRGYCGLRSAGNGDLAGVSAEKGKASWYHDPLPTNCVADWVCAGGTGSGYPEYAHRRGPEYGHTNLAVFFHACPLDCLYCQNWTYRLETASPVTVHPEELVRSVTPDTSCICFFGGDPAAQVPFALQASRTAVRRRGGGILRICWETNGYASPFYLEKMAALSLESGGCIKFDLKAWNRDLHRALTGFCNRPVLENFAKVARRAGGRPDPPLLVASTLLVPGYVDAEEVRQIAGFIAGIDPDIPYCLLAFYPQFRMRDLPTTSREQSEACLEAAREAGLRRIRLGNVHLLA